MDCTFFIHIGLHKTGSTAIQQLLLHERGRLRQLGYYRPLAGTETHRHSHHDLAREIDHVEPSQTGPIIDQLRQELDAAGQPGIVVISAEGFALNIANRSMLDRLAGFTARLGYRPHILAYVRPQPQAINSAYTQQVKTWRTREPFAQFFAARLRHPALDYRARLGPLLADRRFKVTIRPYNHEALARGLCVDFLTTLGFPLDEAVTFSVPRPFNVSPGPKTIAAMQHIARKLDTKGSVSPTILAAMSRPLMRTADGYGWNATKFDGINERRLSAARELFAESNDAFAQAAWGRDWLDMFPEERERAAMPNLFRLTAASDAERREFLDFVSEAMAAIRDLAATGDASFLSEMDQAT